MANLLTFKRKVSSKDNSVQKYIFYTKDKLIVEFSYINKNDGKHIICIPSQTMCNIGCKFCHTTDYIGKIRCQSLSGDELLHGVSYVCNDMRLTDKKTLLISYMGCGEPMFNIDGVIDSMMFIKEKFSDRYVRFAIATCLPEHSYHKFFEFVEKVERHHLPVKLHLSLHYTMDQIRTEWMNKSMNIIPSISAVDFFSKKTGNTVEIHYALLEGINDTEQDAILLSNLIKDKHFNVKFLFYNEKDSLDIKPSQKEKLSLFKKYFNKYNIDHEYYIPPGLDVGASCGQFLMDEYLEKGE